MNESQSIDILLSTYNGAEFLSAQLESILAQTFGGWRLVIRDDGSTDDTVRIIEDFVSSHPEKIRFVRDGKSRLGAGRSFAELLFHSEADYVMFSDQDDIWLPDKVEATLSRMMEAESYFKGPVLVHTDMEVVDRDLKNIASSFWDYQRLDPSMKSLNHLLVLNNVTGCTVMMNRNLKEAVLPMPPEAILHDWWAALVASALGRIEFLNEPTVLYRQHGRNEAGATRYAFDYFASRAKNLERSAGLLKRVVEQARAFLRVYGGRLSEGQIKSVKSFSTLLEKGRFGRAGAILRHRLWGAGFLRSAGIATLLVAMKGARS